MLAAVLIFIVVMAVVCAYLAFKGEIERDLGDLPDFGDRWIRRK